MGLELRARDRKWKYWDMDQRIIGFGFSMEFANISKTQKMTGLGL